jgi:hypothetical protein
MYFQMVNLEHYSYCTVSYSTDSSKRSPMIGYRGVMDSMTLIPKLIHQEK